MEGHVSRRTAVSQRVAALQEANDGLLTRALALRAGVSEAQVTWRLRSGAWVRVYREVYTSAGVPVTDHRRHRAALLAVGPRAVLAHRSAAWLHGLGDVPRVPELLVPDDERCRLGGLLIRRSRLRFTPVLRQGLRCTGVVRTLFDCAALFPPAELSVLVDRVFAVRTVRLDVLVRALSHAANSNHPGRVRLERELAQRHLTDVPPPSMLESEFRRLLQRSGLPLPVAELTWQGGRYRLDFAYPDRRLAIEVDGYAFHSRPAQMQADYQRRNQLVQDGWSLLLFTWADVVYDPQRVVATIRRSYEATQTAS